MTYMRYGWDMSQDDVGPDDDGPPTYCPGPSYDDAHGCGRFLSVGAWMCVRCRAETSDYWKDDAKWRAKIDRRSAELINAERLYWESPEAQAMLAAGTSPVFDEDLPF